jgi:hypothetical protein
MYQKEALIVEIIKVPDWPAPWRFCCAFHGLILLAEDLAYDGSGEEFNPYLCPKEITLEILAKKSAQAANYFQTHCPPKQEYFSFRIDEARLLKEFNIVDVDESERKILSKFKDDKVIEPGERKIIEAFADLGAVYIHAGCFREDNRAILTEHGRSLIGLL